MGANRLRQTTMSSISWPTSVSHTHPGRKDFLCLGALLLLWFCILMLRYDALPLQIWDEARLANSAQEMVESGNWLVPTYGDIPDHWSAKPPLLIWQMATLMWLGFPPLLAVRLPTALAALATVVTMWAICRYALCDRGAAFLSGVLLLAAPYYSSIHMARTGDYDVPLSFLIFLYAVAFWQSVDQEQPINIKWFGLFVGGLVLAVMTKGVVGTFALPGLFVFCLLRGQLVVALSDFRVWLFALLALFLCLGYFGSRELYDPGYLQAVWLNELGNRFSSTMEGHRGSPLFYIRVLIVGFEPGVILFILTILTILEGNVRRRSMATLCLLCAATISLLLTMSQTKIYWYAAPILPFLAIAAALGVTDGLRWIKVREAHLPKLFHARPLQVALGILLAIVSAVSAASLSRNQIMNVREAEQSFDGQLWYGALFDELKARGNSSVIVLDSGSGLNENYNPVLKFYAGIARMKGLRVRLPAFDTIPSHVIIHSGAFEGVRNYNPYADIAKGVRVESPLLIPTSELVASCDPRLIPYLKSRQGFVMGGQVHSCVFGLMRP